MFRENAQASQTRDEAVSLPRLPAADLAHIVQHGEVEWRALCGQRFFITGGTGFFGIWLLEAIAAANQTLGAEIQVWVLSRDPQSFLQRAPHLASSEFHWLTGDVRDFDFPRGQFDNIVHAATPASAVLNDTDPRTMFDTIVQGTERTLEFALASGCKRFLLTSSGAVYGQQPTDMPKLAETFNGGPDCSSPGSAYAEGKRAAELLCAIAAREHALEIKIARCFAFVGPHLPLNAHFAIGNFLRDALQDRPITVESDGSPIRSYLYAADLVIWLLAILVRGKSGLPYNVGSDASISIGKLAELVAAEQEVARPVHIKQTPRENRLPSRYVPDITRARDDLGLNVRIGLQDAIRSTLTWHRLIPSAFPHHSHLP